MIHKKWFGENLVNRTGGYSPADIQDFKIPHFKLCYENQVMKTAQYTSRFFYGNNSFILIDLDLIKTFPNFSCKELR